MRIVARLIGKRDPRPCSTKTFVDIGELINPGSPEVGMRRALRVGVRHVPWNDRHDIQVLIGDHGCGHELLPLTGYASKAEVAAKARNKDDFSAMVAAVQGGMVPGGRYEFVDGSERKTIDANLAEMRSLFDQFETVSAMDRDAKFKLYVDQENVDAILARRDDRRLICKSERPVGSLIPSEPAAPTARSGVTGRTRRMK
ncbi:MAG TPA: hypothetical protein VN043_08520 [Rhodanobacter sp.]|nr:hypothetical protein [Rhodanobacter sp.]